MNEENANRAVHPTTMPSALSAFRLRSRLGCRKQVVVGDLGRSPRNIGLPAYGTRYPSATILATEHSPRSTSLQTPHAYRLNTMSQGGTARLPREHDFVWDRWQGFRDGNDICHSRHTEANRAMKTDVQVGSFRAVEPQQLRFHAVLDHERKSANRPMDRITTPAALLARRLRSSLWCQKRVVIGHRGRSAEKYILGSHDFRGILTS